MLHNLVTFVQLKKRGKHPWRSIKTRFLNCTNVTKLHKTSHIDMHWFYICLFMVYDKQLCKKYKVIIYIFTSPKLTLAKTYPPKT